ncbi:hypothetical protein QYF61_020751 [Mycteria americana]|uniref:Uncharacterized protein n=1 Tax=Mycteria americana TaxID=33587 RepID=A0AAN7N4R9_MYCAM|nr:hypothetical protein QYF61_020751 [Mycteria americana]
MASPKGLVGTRPEKRAFGADPPLAPRRGSLPWGRTKRPRVHVFPVLRTPELDAVLRVGSHQSAVEGQNPLPRPAGHAALDAAQDTVGFLGCKRTLLAHVQLFIHQYPQVLLLRAALNPFIPQPALILGVAPTQMQDLALGLVDPHEVHMGPLLQLAQVPLDGIPSLRYVNRTTQLGVVSKLAEGALDPTVHVVDEDTKQYWSQTPLIPDLHPDIEPLTTTLWSPRPSSQFLRHRIVHPSNPSLQCREKDVVGDHVKGLTEVQIDDILALPLSSDVVTPSEKATRLVRQDLPVCSTTWHTTVFFFLAGLLSCGEVSSELRVTAGTGHLACFRQQEGCKTRVALQSFILISNR